MRSIALALALFLTACAGSVPLPKSILEAADDTKNIAQETLGAVEMACVAFPAIQDGVQVPAPVQRAMKRCDEVQASLRSVMRAADLVKTGEKRLDVVARDLHSALDSASELVRDIESL